MSDDHDAADPALEWFREIVEPTVAEFMSEPSSKRRECLAVLAVASMTEHYFNARYERNDEKARKTALRKFKGEVRDNQAGTGYFSVGLVADLANATKHVITDRGISHKTMQLLKINTFGTMRFGWPRSKNPEILVGDNREWRLVDLLGSAMEYWQDKLQV